MRLLYDNLNAENHCKLGCKSRRTVYIDSEIYIHAKKCFAEYLMGYEGCNALRVY